MIVVDIGNTDTVIAGFVKKKIIFTFRFKTTDKNLFWKLNQYFKMMALKLLMKKKYN